MNLQPQTIVLPTPFMNLAVSQNESQRLLQPLFMPPLLPAPVSTPALAPATGRIEGQVLRSDNHAPVTEASVFIAGLDDAAWLAWDITIEHGTYAFSEVSPGDYSLTLIWDQSGRLQDNIDEVLDLGWEGDWLVTRGKNGVVVATASLAITDDEMLCKDWQASFLQP